MSKSGTIRLLAPSQVDAITFGVLGPLEVSDGGRVLPVSGPQERALLALLLTRPGQVFSVRAIVAGMWGDDPPRGAEKTVQSYVSRLRRALPDAVAGLVVTRSPGYLVDVAPDQVDAERFRSLADAGRRDLGGGRADAAAGTLREALALWRGDAYAEFEAPFADAQRTQLDELRLTAMEDRIDADLAVGAGPGLVGELEVLVTEHPLRERLWAQLMTALYRAGRQGDALGAYQRARASLVDELGVEPGPDLQAVEAAVLAHDTGLLPGPSPGPSTSAVPHVGPVFVGREAELARLRAAYDEASRGAVVRLLVTGPHGMGKSRLLAELAREVQARGGVVADALPPTPAGRTAARAPDLLVVDDLQRVPADRLAGLAAAVRSAPAPLLVVGACVTQGLSTEQAQVSAALFPARLDLPPLPTTDVESLVRLYVPDHAVAEAVSSAAVEAAAGVPLQVHAAAGRYAEDLASSRVDTAAAQIAGPLRLLAESREQVADGVADLHRLRLVRAAQAPEDLGPPVCPYKGLAFFDVEDSPYFFGRERLVAHLVARLVDAPLLAVVGASGSGKSSVLRAGLVAAVGQGLLPGSDRWHVVLTAPSRPRPELPSSGWRTLLVVDQLEELFTAVAEPAQAGYADWLTAAAHRTDVTVVVAVRSDYFGRVTAHSELADLMTANAVLVGSMSGTEVLRAVELPTAAAGLELEPGLARIIAGDVEGEPGGLPLLSTALLSLWERRDGRRLTLAAYRELGGVRTAVARMAEAAYGQLSPGQQVIARRTLLRLAETGEGGEPVRRRVPLPEVAPPGDADAREVLDRLAARRLLTVSQSHAEVSHEALLREWPRLQAWLDDDEAGRRLRRHLAPAVLAWRDGGDPAELYRGSRLAAALEWSSTHPADVTDDEHAFLRASQEATDRDAVRRRRSIRRLRVLAVGLTGVLVVAVTAGWVAVDQREAASRSTLQADVRALGVGSLEESRWDRALLFAAQAYRLDPSTASHAALLETVHRSPEAMAIHRASQPLGSVAVSADGAVVAASGADSVHVWDTRRPGPARVVDDVTWAVSGSIDISPDGRYVLVVGPPAALMKAGLPAPSQVVVVDLAQEPPTVHALGEPGGADGSVTSARFTADGRTVVEVGGDGRVRYVDVGGDVERRVVSRVLDLDVGASGAVAVDAPDSRRFMVAYDPTGPGPVTVWDVVSGQVLWAEDVPDAVVASVSPDGGHLVLGHADGRIEIVDARPGGSRKEVPADLESGLLDLAWSPDGASFAGATQEHSVLVWDAESLSAHAVVRGPHGTVAQTTFSPDGASLYAASDDGSVFAWDVTGTRGVMRRVGPLPRPGALGLAMSADGSVTAARYGDGRVDVFDVTRERSFEVVVPGQADWMFADRVGRFVGVITIGESARGSPWTGFVVHVIDVERGVLLPQTFGFDGRNSYDAAFTWDGEGLVTAGGDLVDRWDLDTGERQYESHFMAAARVLGVTVSPDGRHVALGEEGGFEVVDMLTGRLVSTLPVPDALCCSTAEFSPDGRWVANGDGVGRVLVWDPSSGEVRRSLQVDRDVDVAAFLPDARSVLVSGAGTASLWGLEEGASRGATLDVDPGRTGADARVGLQDDGRTVVSFTEATGLRRWDVTPDRLAEHACQVAGRNLTAEEWAGVLPDRAYERTCPEHPAG